MRTTVLMANEQRQEHPGCTGSVDTITVDSRPFWVKGTLRIWNGNVRETSYEPGEWVSFETVAD